ncbi:MAG: hypothetical protein V3R22_00695 [Kiloniellales bacterium]
MLRRVRPFAASRRPGFPGRYALAVVVFAALGPGVVSHALAGQEGGVDRGLPSGGLDLRITGEDLPSYRQEPTGSGARAAEETSPASDWSRSTREDEAYAAGTRYRWQSGQPVYRGDELRPKTQGLNLFHKD